MLRGKFFLTVFIDNQIPIHMCSGCREEIPVREGKSAVHFPSIGTQHQRETLSITPIPGISFRR